MVSAASAAVARLRKSWVAATALDVRQYNGLILDVVERGVTAVLLSAFAVRLVEAELRHFDFVVLLLIVSEVVPVALIVTRRFSKAVSHNPADWVFGFVGASAPLLAVAAPAAPLVPAAICGVMMLSGLVLQISAKLALGRSFGIVAANRGVKRGGPYRVIRHPMYAGYTLTHVGFLLACPSFFNLALYAAAFVIQVVRLLREEEILRRDPKYAGYAAAVRYRLLPGLF